MITLENACYKILEEFPGMKIGNIIDIGTSWIFGIVDKEHGYEPDISIEPAIDKETGEYWILFPPDYPNYSKVMKKSTKIEIPTQFKN